ncbi:Uncharacterised protein [Leclercia adecarboxylata]|uniref:Uncharacterized protein n=1 Tax=Leclercia adecarboxylata TaxID=83655 RepID=A0A4U9HYI0_9ENTR|nr:Uncharacterised protein [Leclercia adecarboxylata]
MRFWRMTECQNKQMLALGPRQAQPAGDTVEHLTRRRTAASLFKPGVPGGTDMGKLRYLFTAQPRRTPSAADKTKRCRIKAQASRPQKIAQRLHCHRHHRYPVKIYTLIRSLLLPFHYSRYSGWQPNLEVDYASIFDGCERVYRFADSG